MIKAIKPYRAVSILLLALPWGSVSAEAVQYRPMTNFDEFFEAQKQYEKQLYSALPDRIDCETQQHLERCEDINFLLKKHPDAPIRLPSNDGQEVVIDANAPTPLVNFILSPDEDGAKQTLEWFRGLRGRMKSVQTNILREGYREQASGDRPSTDGRSDLIGDGSSVEVVMVTESSCPACRFQLGVMSNLISLYPEMSVKVFQVNDDQTYFDREVIDKGFTGRVLSKEEVDALEITGWPYSIITDQSNTANEKFYGTKALPSMITLLARLSSQEVPDEAVQ